MDIFKDFLTAISRLWDWLRKNKKWVFQGIGVAVPIALVGLVVTADRNSDPAVAEAIETLSRELERKAQALADAQQREQSLQTALHKAISALPEQTEIPDAQARIKEALALAADGNTALAEAIFSEVEARKVAEGKAARESAYKEAAAARHRGALAFLHNTDKAVAAYRRATELDPENADGWNQFGLLLRETGRLNDAEVAYRKVESLSKAENNQGLLATAYSNLGDVYRTRSDLDQAEAMYKKALAIDEAISK